MKVVRGLSHLRSVGSSVLTIGVFDGVHVGHKAIISKVTARAKSLGVKSVAVTFDPHPLKALHPSSYVPSLMSLPHRIRLIKELGVDVVIVLKFTRSLAALSPAAFVKGILVNKLGAREVYIGENFYFGKGGQASAAAMKKLAHLLGVKTTIVRCIKIDRRVVSSSLIRGLIVTGELDSAKRLLGRSVSILGTVAHGVKRGRILGFPTANMDPHHEAIPPGGVYAVRVRLNGRVLKGILNIGVRPTFYRDHIPEPAIEVHIFNFNKNIYGEDIEIIFVKKIRPERTFKDRLDLAAQITKDCRKARAILGRR